MKAVESSTYLSVCPLDRADFAAFGDVLQLENAQNFPINDGMAIRFHDLARVTQNGPGGQVLINLFRARPYEPPIAIATMERHPLGSQSFVAMHDHPWLVVVAPDEDGKPGTPRAFRLATGDTGIFGINYAPNIWHHPLIALEAECDFLVIDRGGEGKNLEEYRYRSPYFVESL